ncbi:hypothetical protein GA599_09675, partial [Bifidobacterium adolescentis]
MTRVRFPSGARETTKAPSPIRFRIRRRGLRRSALAQDVHRPRPQILHDEGDAVAVRGEHAVREAVPDVGPDAEAQGHDFFRIGGMDISKDGRWMLY